MGTFSHSYVVVDSTPEALIDFYRLDGTDAFIYPDGNNFCAICDDNDDEPDLNLLAKLTEKLQAKAFLGQVFDSSVFVATIFDKGVVVDEYIDYPDPLPGLVTGNPILYMNRAITIDQRAAEWASLFNVPHQEKTLADLLRRRNDYLFAEDFHEAVLQTLTLPTFMLGLYFVQIERAYMTDQELRKALLCVNVES
jgi:hypothetical protein